MCKSSTLIDFKSPESKGKPKDEAINYSKVQQQKHWHWFKFGGLRFGVHGLAGISSTLLVSTALIHLQHESTLPLWLVVCITIATCTTAWGSYSLLPQVPVSSRVTYWIIPPHREAFRRTIAVMGYLNLRLLHQHFLRDWDINAIQLAFCMVLLVYNLNFFCPKFHKRVDWTNGNTWVFVFPMWLGLSCDTLHQIPSWRNDSNSNTNLLDIDLDWDRVKRWNNHGVNVPYIVLTMFCTLQVAFLFTLAFRGYVTIQTCYWTAAAVVAILCYGLYINNCAIS